MSESPLHTSPRLAVAVDRSREAPAGGITFVVATFQGGAHRVLKGEARVVDMVHWDRNLQRTAYPYEIFRLEGELPETLTEQVRAWVFTLLGSRPDNGNVEEPEELACRDLVEL